MSYPETDSFKYLTKYTKLVEVQIGNISCKDFTIPLLHESREIIFGHKNEKYLPDSVQILHLHCCKSGYFRNIDTKMSYLPKKLKQLCLGNIHVQYGNLLPNYGHYIIPDSVEEVIYVTLRSDDNEKYISAFFDNKTIPKYKKILKKLC